MSYTLNRPQLLTLCSATGPYWIQRQYLSKTHWYFVATSDNEDGIEVSKALPLPELQTSIPFIVHMKVHKWIGCFPTDRQFPSSSLLLSPPFIRLERHIYHQQILISSCQPAPEMVGVFSRKYLWLNWPIILSSSVPTTYPRHCCAVLYFTGL